MRLGPLLERFGRDLDTRVTMQTRELLTTAAKQFDPADPTSPMSKHTRELQMQQATLAATLQRQHADLTSKVEELTTAWKVATSARNAAATTAQVTPIKGTSYESEVREIMGQITLGLGDEYADTGSTTGALSRSKKGDGVLTPAEPRGARDARRRPHRRVRRSLAGGDGRCPGQHRDHGSTIRLTSPGPGLGGSGRLRAWTRQLADRNSRDDQDHASDLCWADRFIEQEPGAQPGEDRDKVVDDRGPGRSDGRDGPVPGEEGQEGREDPDVEAVSYTHLTLPTKRIV